ncbi:protein arginine kinase [Proteiniborus ethanoligenes]|uniref:Protein-arginine kinase n=1 Tax=Proteiniborus ethanoligenes TaxID=415015 RepID=A0A1H3RJD0_9FIRM|nr:protein arginine kinase [Proteiniborus ethanoligenes]SDZ25797.1 protein arginine kinase [Proteiniborus ethanoligenes]
MINWLEGEGAEKDIVLSTRIRLARNIDGIRLPHLMTEDEAKEVIDIVKDAIINNDNSFRIIEINKLSPLERNVFVETHLISPGLLEKPKLSAFFLKQDEKITIMVNEEDHIRIQVLLPGLNLEEGWKLGNEIDDLLESKTRYAFDEDFGFLTCCPTNVGTGLRASVMVHLPALVLTGYINQILQAVNQIGLTVRGLYGEGSSALGNLFQISNQTTLGESEEETIQKLRSIVLQIISKERYAMLSLLNNRKTEIEDKVYRSLGILQNSRIMSSKESMELLSNVRMGVNMNIIKNVSLNTINNLMIEIQPASVQNQHHEDLTVAERDIKRSEIIREKIKM